MSFKLEHDRPNCIGCAACAGIAPEFWEMDEDGKSDIVGSKLRDDGWEELKVDDEFFEINEQAAESCPVNVIHITKDGERLI